MTCAPGTPGWTVQGGSVEGPPSAWGVVLHALGERGDVVLAALRSARNVRAELADASLEIVVQGGAVGSVVTVDEMAAEVLRAVREVRVDAALCHNSLLSLVLVDAHVPAGVLVVPAVAHLARRQWQGWAYVPL